MFHVSTHHSMGLPYFSRHANSLKMLVQRPLGDTENVDRSGRGRRMPHAMPFTDSPTHFFASFFHPLSLTSAISFFLLLLSPSHLFCFLFHQIFPSLSSLFELSLAPLFVLQQLGHAVHHIRHTWWVNITPMGCCLATQGVACVGAGLGATTPLFLLRTLQHGL